MAAAELKSSGLPAYFKNTLVDTILKNWKDGRKALDWAESQLTGELRCKAVAGALGILVKSEPEAAFGYFEKLPPGETRRQTISDLFAAWGSHDPETALIRAKELTPEDTQSATEHVLRGWAKTDPTAAAAWVLKTAPTDGKWLAGVYQSWISIAPEQARGWFDSLPEGDAKRTAYFLTHQFQRHHRNAGLLHSRRVVGQLMEFKTNFREKRYGSHALGQPGHRGSPLVCGAEREQPGLKTTRRPSREGDFRQKRTV